jgi:hypothetical protein
MNNIVKNQDHLPSTPMPLADAVTQLFRDRDRLKQVRTYCYDIAHHRYGNPDEKISVITETLEQFDQFVEHGLPIIIDNLERAVHRKATSEDIAVAVAVLIHSFPNVKDNFDSSIFSQQLIRFFEEWQIGEGVLGFAMRHLVLNHKWLPSISEIKDAVDEASKTLFNTWTTIHGDPDVSNDAGILGVRSTLEYYLNDATKDKRRNEERREKEIIDK